METLGDGVSAVPAAGNKVLVNKGPRACSTCARAKSRCVAGPPRQDKCERCYRLRKPCSSQTPAPPRKRKEPKPTRVAELERRLEDLTARIESVQHPPVVAEPNPLGLSDPYSLPPYRLPPLEDLGGPRTISGTQAPMPSFSRDRWDSPFGHIFPERNIFEDPVPPSGNNAGGGLSSTTGSTSSPALSGLTSSSTAQPPPTPRTTSGSTTPTPHHHHYQQPKPQQQQQTENNTPIWPEGAEAESLLATYRKHLAQLFPFAVVPLGMTAQEMMRQGRPFFCKAILMVACLFDGRRQSELGKALLREVGEAAFMNPQKTLDLLQGLQMLIAWNHYNLNNFQMVNLLFLARSVTISLGFAELKGLPPGQGGYDSERLEQMRAFAGTYYLVTITFTTNKRPDALMNTSYLATCCRALHSHREYPTDELVVHLVRAQQLSQSISQGFARRKAGHSESQVPQAAFVQVLQERIRGFAAALPPHSKSNASLAGHLHVAEILIYENCLDELNYACRSGSSSMADDHAGPGRAPALACDEIAPACVKMLWASARLVHTFLTNRLSGAVVAEYPRFIRLSSFDLTYVFLTLLRLVTLQVPGWDLVRAREELHFDEFVTELIRHMERTAERRTRRSNNHENPGPDDEHVDPFIKVAGKIRFVKDCLHANGFDSDYATSQIARVCDPAPMTLVDATQDLLQDIGGGIWQDLTTGTTEWDLFFGSEAVDWTAVFNDYNNMAESGYGM